MILWLVIVTTSNHKINVTENTQMKRHELIIHTYISRSTLTLKTYQFA